MPDNEVNVDDAIRALRVLTRLYSAEVLFEAAAALLGEGSPAAPSLPAPAPALGVAPPAVGAAEGSALRGPILDGGRPGRAPQRRAPATTAARAATFSWTLGQRLRDNSDAIRAQASTWPAAAALRGLLDRTYGSFEEAAKAYQIQPSTVYRALIRIDQRRRRSQGQVGVGASFGVNGGGA